jgi:uncharacterized protein with FMN-binding domain
MDFDIRQTLPPPTPPAPIDPAMQERLARLTASRAPRDIPAATGRTSQPTGRPRKRHAAKGSRTAAVLMSITTAAGLSAYFQHVDTAAASGTTSTATGTATASGTATAASTASTPASTATATASSAATPAASASTSSPLADGTYAGATDTNRWGPVQVQITVTGGKITQVTALQTPTDNRKSVSINTRATPTLASEVLSAQSASIDTVSGATYTSDSYKVSLQSAIDLARSTAVQTSTAP